jgi:hypothetical protein
MHQVLISLMKQQQEDSRRGNAQEVARLQDMKDERRQHEAEQERQEEQHEAEQEQQEEQEANRRKEEQERFDRLLATLQPGQQQPPQQQQAGGGGGVAPQAAAQGHTARPTAKAPPTLDKDMDFKKFVQWRKTWTN